MEKKNLDILLISSPQNFRYFTGLDSYFWESPTRPWFLLLSQNNDPIAIVPSIGETALKKTWIKDIKTWQSPNPEDEGISTLTNQFVKKVKQKTKICCTRKTTPNLRLLEKYAVKKGGGYNHRFNLSDEILIKENHISSESALRKLIIKALKTKKIVTVEIENIEQLKQVLGLNFKRILFDNMKISQLKKCIKICKKKFETEYSGNANLGNIKKISKTGVQRISVGSITHSSKSFDSSLLI